MIITYRSYTRSFDTPIYIHYLSVFIGCLFDELYHPCEIINFCLFDDNGRLIGRSASYDGVSYAE